jgi:hypothetical protein
MSNSEVNSTFCCILFYFMNCSLLYQLQCVHHCDFIELKSLISNHQPLRICSNYELHSCEESSNVKSITNLYIRDSCSTTKLVPSYKRTATVNVNRHWKIGREEIKINTAVLFILTTTKVQTSQRKQPQFEFSVPGSKIK